MKEIETGQLKEDLNCPYCNQGADGYTGEGKPEDGNFCICGYCFKLNIYVVRDGIVSLRKATKAEEEDLQKNNPQDYNLMLALAQRALARIQKKYN